MPNTALPSNALAWLTFVAFAVGLVVRLLKADKFNDVLARFSIPAIPKRALPWVSLVLGFGGMTLEARISGAAWSPSLLAGAWGLLSGAGAIAGHDALAPVVAKLAPGLAKLLFGVDPKPAAPPKEPSSFLPPLPILVLFGALAIGAPSLACAPVLAALPTVIAAVQDAAMILDQIEKFADAYFAAHPDDTKRAKVEMALAQTRSALQVALRASEGAEELDQAKVDAAFADFRAAYLELTKLLYSFGIAAPAGALGAGPDQLVLPEPLALKVKVPS